MIAVITHNRAHLLRRCVEDVLHRTSPETAEIIIWDNASEDDTRTYLSGVKDPRIKIVHHEANIGTNAYAEAVRLTSSPYIVEVDDDVIEAPHHWDRTLLEAFRKIPKIGYLVADLEENPNDSAYRYLKYVKEKGNVYTSKEVGGVRILEGPTGSGCAMTSREVYDRVGGFGRHKKLVFWHEDAAYVQAVRKWAIARRFSRSSRSGTREVLITPDRLSQRSAFTTTARGPSPGRTSSREPSCGSRSRRR